MISPVDSGSFTASALQRGSVLGVQSGEASFAASLQSSGTVNLDDIFERAAAKYGLDPNLLKAIGYIESRYQSNAVSSAGAMGVMQLMPDTAAHLGVADAFDPEQNIMGAAKLLAEHLDQYGGNMELAVAAYNCGVGTVAKYGGTVPPFTQNYISLINEVMQNELNAPAISWIGSGPFSNSKNSPSAVSGNSSALASLGLMMMYRILENMASDKDDEDKNKIIF